MTLYTLKKKLEACRQDVSVIFDFGNLYPDGFMSWRGDYSQIALGFTDSPRKSVEDLIADVNSAIGTEFHGYKGGEFLMREDTKVWVDNYSKYSNVELLDVIDMDYYVILTTKNNNLPVVNQ